MHSQSHRDRETRDQACGHVMFFAADLVERVEPAREQASELSAAKGKCIHWRASERASERQQVDEDRYVINGDARPL